MKIRDIIWDTNGTKAFSFLCPGCGERHALVEGRWAFNGDYERPTFTPSVLVSGDGAVCHSFVTDGRIQFLSDCTHSLAGQTVELPEINVKREGK
jgi:hypothetical protein